MASIDPPGYNGKYTILSSTKSSVTYTLATNPGNFVNGGTVIAGDIVTTRTSPVKTVDVLSTARPAAPNQLYSVPAFGWSSSVQGKTTESTRAGGWLRVYLDRPWFSSGDGELLGVVLVNQLSEASGKPRRGVSLYPGFQGPAEAGRRVNRCANAAEVIRDSMGPGSSLGLATDHATPADGELPKCCKDPVTSLPR